MHVLIDETFDPVRRPECRGNKVAVEAGAVNRAPGGRWQRCFEGAYPRPGVAPKLCHRGDLRTQSIHGRAGPRGGYSLRELARDHDECRIMRLRIHLDRLEPGEVQHGP